MKEFMRFLPFYPFSFPYYIIGGWGEEGLMTSQLLQVVPGFEKLRVTQTFRSKIAAADGSSWWW